MSSKSSPIGDLLLKCLFKIPLTEKESDELDRWCVRTKHYDARQRWSNPKWVAKEIAEMGKWKENLDRVTARIMAKIK